MTELPVPKANAMLICDSVITDKGTNKKSLIGVFEHINAFKFPCVHHSLAVYIKLTDARGKYRFRLELIDLQNNPTGYKRDIKRLLLVILSDR